MTGDDDLEEIDLTTNKVGVSARKVRAMKKLARRSLASATKSSALHRFHTKQPVTLPAVNLPPLEEEV